MSQARAIGMGRLAPIDESAHPGLDRNPTFDADLTGLQFKRSVDRR